MSHITHIWIRAPVPQLGYRRVKSLNVNCHAPFDHLHRKILAHLCDMTHLYVWCDPFECHVTRSWDMIHSYVTWLTLYCDTGWRRLIGCLKLQVIFRKRATNYWALLRKMTFKDQASYDAIHSNVTWLVHMWHASSMCVWYDSFICVHINGHAAFDHFHREISRWKS